MKSDKSGVYSDDRRHAMSDRKVRYIQGSGVHYEGAREEWAAVGDE